MTREEDLVGGREGAAPSGLGVPGAAADLGHAVERGGEEGQDDAGDGLDGDGRASTTNSSWIIAAAASLWLDSMGSRGA